MVLVWFAERKKPRLYRTLQEAWANLVEAGMEGFQGLGFPVRMQVWSAEIGVEEFLSEPFFPKEFLEGLRRTWKMGNREPMMGALRGILMYLALKRRWERVRLLIAQELYHLSKTPFLYPTFVGGEDGKYYGVATFYGRYPVFTVENGIAQSIETSLRSLSLRRMDTYAKGPFSGYTRWLPAEFPPKEEETEEPDPRKWTPIPEFAFALPGEGVPR